MSCKCNRFLALLVKENGWPCLFFDILYEFQYFLGTSFSLFALYFRIFLVPHFFYILNHFNPIFHFWPIKCFCNIFSGYRNGTLGYSNIELSRYLLFWYFLFSGFSGYLVFWYFLLVSGFLWYQHFFYISCTSWFSWWLKFWYVIFDIYYSKSFSI